MLSPGDPSTSRDSSDPDRCLQFPSSLGPVSFGLFRMWHFKLSGICKTIIIHCHRPYIHHAYYKSQSMLYRSVRSYIKIRAFRFYFFSLKSQSSET